MANRFDPRFELGLANTWTDITGFVYQDEGVKIARGRPDEASRVDPGELSLTLDNRDGRFSAHNPTGPYYGLIGRNTPIRALMGKPSIGAAESVNVDLADAVVNHDAPSVEARAAGLLVCGWVSIWVAETTGTGYTVPASMSAPVETSNDHSLMATATQEIISAGATGTRTGTVSDAPDGYAVVSVAIPGTSGAPTIEETWAEVGGTGSPITLTTGSSTAVGEWLLAIQVWSYDHPDTPLTMPRYTEGSPGEWVLVADSQTAAATQPHVRAWVRRVHVAGPQEVMFLRDAGSGSDYANHVRLYRLSGVLDSFPRFVGEVSAWPPRWDPSESDVRTPITAAGILRRLGQGSAPLRSTIRRETLSDALPDPVAYWPCEDARGASSIASGLDGGDPMGIGGDIDLASFSGFDGSEDIPQMRDGTLTGAVPDYTTGDEHQTQWIMHVPTGDVANDTVLLAVHTTGTARRWEVIWGVDGGLAVRAFAPDGSQIHDSGFFAFDADDVLLRAALELTQNGSDVDYGLGAVEAGASTGSVIPGTVAGRTIGRISRVDGGPNGGLAGTALGHFNVHATITSIHDLGQALTGYDGEAAGRRVQRLCDEEDIPFLHVGDLDLTQAMGPQESGTLLDLLRECAAADGGILHESRGELGITYRTRRSIYNQGL